MKKAHLTTILAIGVCLGFALRASADTITTHAIAPGPCGARLGAEAYGPDCASEGGHVMGYIGPRTSWMLRNFYVFDLPGTAGRDMSAELVLAVEPRWAEWGFRLFGLSPEAAAELVDDTPNPNFAFNHLDRDTLFGIAAAGLTGGWTTGGRTRSFDLHANGIASISTGRCGNDYGFGGWTQHNVPNPRWFGRPPCGDTPNWRPGTDDGGWRGGVSAIPEPASLVMLGTGLFGFAVLTGRVWRKRRH